MKKTKKLFLGLVLFIIILFLHSSSFAAQGNSIPISDDFKYDFVMNQNYEKLKAQKELVLKNDLYLSGDYYYFITYNYGDRCYNTYLIKKDVMPSTLNIVFGGFNERGNDHFFINITDVDLRDTGDLILLSGYNGWEINKFENPISTTYGIIASASIHSSENIIDFPFATDFVGKIVRNCSNGTQKVFMNAPTHLAAIAMGAELDKVLAEILEILPVVLITLVSLIALYKGLKMLFLLLHQS